jgi:RNA polymerase sigma-70 factor (ECF subfamily)
MTSTTAQAEFEVTVIPLVDEYLYGGAMKMTRSHAEAEDLVQDTLVRAWRFWGSFRRGTNVKAWLYTIMRNTFINGYHRNGRAAAIGPAVALANSMSQPPEADDVVTARLTAARIREALELLPRDFRLAVELADLEGLSYKEIAELMECPIGTVMSRIYRGRRQMHALLIDHAREIGMVAEQAR